MNVEYHSFYLVVKLRTLDTPLSCQPEIRLTSDREKKHTLDFLYTRFCVFSLLEQQQFIFLPTFSRDFCRSSEKPRVDQCMYNI